MLRLNSNRLCNIALLRPSLTADLKLSRILSSLVDSITVFFSLAFAPLNCAEITMRPELCYPPPHSHPRQGARDAHAPAAPLASCSLMHPFPTSLPHMQLPPQAGPSSPLWPAATTPSPLLCWLKPPHVHHLHQSSNPSGTQPYHTP